jgi:LacI family transcriptional regulator
MNIYDVARLSGVSLSTASKALNGRKDVKEETRQRVIKIATSLNYHPSHLARGLVKRCTENIGVVTIGHEMDPVIVNPFYSRVIEGIEAECMQRNYNMLLSVQPYKADAALGVPKLVREKSVDGLLLLGHMPQLFLEALAKSSIPMVSVDSFNPHVPAHYFLAENQGGAYLAVEHLASLGHKHLGLVAGSQSISSFAQRRQGFVRACQAFGLTFNEVTALEDSLPNSMDWMRPLMQASRRPSGVFCCNDNYAHHFMALCNQMGIKVPEQVSVVGFDDIDLAAMLHPPLTTMRVPKQEMGSRAVQRLMQLIETPGLPKETVTLPVELRVRASTAKA